MDIFIILLALLFLIFAAYRGFSVILFAPIAALLAVLLTSPAQVLPFFSAVFMEKMVGTKHKYNHSVVIRVHYNVYFGVDTNG